MKHRDTNKPRSGFKYFITAALGGLAIMFGIYQVGERTNRPPGVSTGGENEPTVSQLPDEKMAPGEQGDSGSDLAAGMERWVPEAQQGLETSQAQVQLEVSVDQDFPSFNQRSLNVKPGQIVSLTFRNNATIDQQHSWVLVQPGKEDEVALAATQAGPNKGYMPVLPDAIIAKTRMLAPGDSETILFRAPDKEGSYPFICVFPGHARGMRGELQVRR